MKESQGYQQWLDSPLVEAALKQELLGVRDDAAEREDRFYRELDFGTAGLRGVIGAGSNRMNIMVVRRAARGLGAYLNELEGAARRGVAIAYDSRRYSGDFAREVARTLASAGVRCYLFESLRSVPQLSFAILHLNCIAGVVITASHNPPEYNGLKVYWEHGGQLGLERARAVTEHILTQDPLCSPGMPMEQALAEGLVVMIGKEVDEAYYAATAGLLEHPALDLARGGQLKLVYTPLHGAGSVPVKALLNRCGFTDVAVVPEQEAPDAAFPTVTAPNPEDPRAFGLAFALADEIGADIAVATDPDADRMGLALRNASGKMEVLGGNQIGCLLLYYLLSQKKAKGTLPENGLAVRSFVSTRLADAICAGFGVQLVETLTGFRFISGTIDQCKRGGGGEFLFGFEESYGYLAGTVARDKDAICATLLIAEAALYYQEQGRSLRDVLHEIDQTYGYYMERTGSYTLAGKAGMEAIAGAMEALRKEPPAAFGPYPVLQAADYLSRTRLVLATGEVRPEPLPRADALLYELPEGDWICIRPSGTEPKLKFYVGASHRHREGLNAKLSQLYGETDTKLKRLLGV